MFQRHEYSEKAFASLKLLRDWEDTCEGVGLRGKGEILELYSKTRAGRDIITLAC